MKKKNLIYIIGAGRSGTTLLDIILGNTSSSISLGEINRFFKRAGIPPKRANNDEVFLFWEKIKKDFDEKFPGTNYDDLAKVFHRNEYHSTVIKNVIRGCDQEYMILLSSHYNVIFDNVIEENVVESSKYPLRAFNISKALKDQDINVKYIYIKKDPVKVVKSFTKKDIEQPSKNFIASNIYYLLVNMLCSFIVKRLKRKGHKTYEITFEKLMNDPVGSLRSLADEFNMDLSEVESLISAKKALSTGFLFDGNRIRIKDALFLRVQEKEEKKDFKFYLIRGFNFLVYR